MPALEPSTKFISAGVALNCVELSAAKTGIVPDTFGNLIVLSAVGSIVVKVVSWSSAEAPSNTKAFWIFTCVELTVVVVPETVRLPEMVTSSSMVTVPPAESIVKFPDEVSISPAAVTPIFTLPNVGVIPELPTAVPPAVEPSCSLNIVFSVSTVNSPTEPV